jgi:8-oxo-dGTP pyrophosphatase MutT (NUDIX family)
MEIVYEAGAIAYRKSDQGFLFLIERSKKDPSQWIFPKGHIEDGEDEIRAAVRELEEEAGVTGVHVSFIGTSNYVFKGKEYRVAYHLFRYTGDAGGGEKDRDPSWHAASDAGKLLTFEDARNLMQKAVDSLAGVICT